MMKQVVGACSVLLAVAAAAWAQTPAGPEFRVNTYTTGYQGFAFQAMEPDGDFVPKRRSAHDPARCVLLAALTVGSLTATNPAPP